MDIEAITDYYPFTYQCSVWYNRSLMLKCLLSLHICFFTLLNLLYYCIYFIDEINLCFLNFTFQITHSVYIELINVLIRILFYYSLSLYNMRFIYSLEFCSNLCIKPSSGLLEGIILITNLMSILYINSKFLSLLEFILIIHLFKIYHILSFLLFSYHLKNLYFCLQLCPLN